MVLMFGSVEDVMAGYGGRLQAIRSTNPPSTRDLECDYLSVLHQRTTTRTGYFWGGWVYAN
jgi:hypothetical protein